MKALLAPLCAVALSSCTTTYVGVPKMTEAQVRALVVQLPDSQEKSVSLAVMNNPNSKYRIDHHGYPTWRWRGKDDLGSCVHIDPQTLKPYLENQFSRANRTDVPKYIDFGTDGQDWMCRIHHFNLTGEVTKNWSSEQCHRDGKRLLGILDKVLGKSK